ncbi:MAG: hypothetical protein EBR82_41935 [Caulobacteraceae bacterium]|nr:hypothetical protein [Caulobacteraceae bacterium]
MISIGRSLVLSEHNRSAWQDPAVNGSAVKRGLVPRNYASHPAGSYEGAVRAVDLRPIPAAEWPDRLRDLRASGALLSQIRAAGKDGRMIPSTDQNGRGYCWYHSGVSCCLLVRARDGQPFSDLSAYAGACKIKGFRDEGGWGAQGVDFMRKYGTPTSQFWPQRSTSRAHDNESTWADALKYRVDEGWIDLDSSQYNRNLAWSQVVTCLLSGHPVVCDYNWWGHSVCGMDLVDGQRAFADSRLANGKRPTAKEFEAVWDMSDHVTGGYGIRIWNSWGDSWSENGEGVLPPSRSVPDGSVAIRTMVSAD